MVKAILINGSHVSNTLKNQYTYKFKGGGLNLDGSKKHYIAVSSITIPYSFFNISDVYGNRTFSIVCNGTTYPVILPPSFMTIDDINKYLQFFFLEKGLYTLDVQGNPVYYMTMRYNVSRYAVQVDFYPLKLTTAGTNPRNLTMSNTTMQLILNNSDAGFGQILGLTPGTYPSAPASVNTSILSNTDVNGSPVQALTLTCNIVNNAISTSPNSFYSFTPNNASFGGNIAIQPPELVWVQCFNGQYQELVIEIRDQLNRPIELRDSNVCIMLCLKDSDENLSII